jgi:hypothetical protein
MASAPPSNLPTRFKEECIIKSIPSPTPIALNCSFSFSFVNIFILLAIMFCEVRRIILWALWAGDFAAGKSSTKWRKPPDIAHLA